MQKIILALAILLLTSVASFAQCDKKVKWQAAKGELVDENGTVIDTKEGPIVITTDSKNIKFEILEKPNESAEGVIGETTCEWKEDFRNGKTVIKATMTGSRGDATPAVFTIEGKDGKLTITVEIERLQGNRVLINVDKYEVI